MKKLFLLISIAFLAIACEGPAGPMGPPGENGGGAGMFVKYYTIESNQWRQMGDDNFYDSYFISPVIRIPQLSQYIHDNGVVMVYLEFADGVQIPLPYTRYFGENNNGDDYLYSELFEFDHSPGEIVLYMRPSDFITERYSPGTWTFKVALIWE